MLATFGSGHGNEIHSAGMIKSLEVIVAAFVNPRGHFLPNRYEVNLHKRSGALLFTRGLRDAP